MWLKDYENKDLPIYFLPFESKIDSTNESFFTFWQFIVILQVSCKLNSIEPEFSIDIFVFIQNSGYDSVISICYN